MAPRPSRRPLAVGAATLLALCLAALPPSPAAATVLMTEDIPVFGVGRSGPELAERGYEVARSMGARMLRLHIGRDREFAFETHMDPFVEDAIRHGFEPYITLTYRDRYRDDQPDPGWLGKPTPAEFGAWCGQAAQRYAGRVLHYGIFNEPNYFGSRRFPDERIDGAEYNELYRACRAAIKAASPAARTYYGEIAADEAAGAPCRYVLAGLFASRPTVADGLAIHTYQWTTPPERPEPRSSLCEGIGRLGDWRLLTAFAHIAGASLSTPSGARPPLLITEHGYCAPTGECPANAAGADSRLAERRRADYAHRALEWAQANGVAVFSYYHLFAQPEGEPLWDSGIVDLDGTPTPTVAALAAAAER